MRLRLTVPEQYVGADEPRITITCRILPRRDFEGRQVLEYRLVSGDVVFEGTDLRSGCGERTNEFKMAATLLNFLGAYGESFHWQEMHHGGWRNSEFAHDHTEEQAQFLMANYERLSMAGMEWSGELGEE